MKQRSITYPDIVQRCLYPQITDSLEFEYKSSSVFHETSQANCEIYIGNKKVLKKKIKSGEHYTLLGIKIDYDCIYYICI